MKKLEKIARNILLNNKKYHEVSEQNNESYFSNPSRGELDYYSFNNFNNKSELAIIFNEYLADLNVSKKDSEELSEIAYRLKEMNNDDSGELSEFIYIMS